MGRLAFHFGKFIFCSAIIFYGYLIIFTPSIKRDFDTNFRTLEKFHPSLKPLEQLEVHLDYIRVGFGAVNLLAVFMIFSNTACIPSILTLAFLLFNAVVNNPLLVNDGEMKQVVVGRLLKNIALVGGLLYLIAYGRCGKCKSEKVAVEEKEKED